MSKKPTRVPQPIHKYDWHRYATLWAEGEELQWWDLSEGAGQTEWEDILPDDPFYPHDPMVVYRIKPEG